MSVISMERISQRQVATNSDLVIAAYPVPRESKILGMNANVKTRVGNVPAQPLEDIVGYGVDGYIVTLQDDHLADTYDIMWDELVPKASETLGFDFVLSSNSAPATEPGEMVQSILPRLLNQQHIYHKMRWMGVQDAPQLMRVITEHTVYAYMPMDQFSINIGEQPFNDMEKALLIGFSSPSMNFAAGEPTGVMPTFGGTIHSEWLWLAYLDQMLEYAIVGMLALTETGAETPYDDLLDFLEHLISSNMIITDNPVAAVWEVFTDSMCMLDIVGRPNVQLQAY